jgi:hypothetical protein
VLPFPFPFVPFDWFLLPGHSPCVSTINTAAYLEVAETAAVAAVVVVVVVAVVVSKSFGKTATSSLFSATKM